MTKLKSNRLGMYADLRPVLDAALKTGGGAYTLETHGKAVHWRQRAYKFRKLYAEMLGPAKESPYDRLTFKRIQPGSATVEIGIIGESLQGQFVGRNEPTDDHDSSVDDDLLEYVKSFANKIAGDEDDE